MTQPAPLAILHVLAPAPAGGLERVVQSLAMGHHARGHRVQVAAMVGPGEHDHPVLTPLRKAGVTVTAVELAGRGYAQERRAVRDLCRTFRPDVVHTHGYRPDILDGGVARKQGIASVTTLHGSSMLGGLTALFERLQFFALRRFDAVVAVSAPLERKLIEQGVRRDRLHLVPNAWPNDVTFDSRASARAELGLPLDGLVVGWTGRLIPVKGGDIHVHALGQIASSPWTAVMIGAGTEQARVMAMVQSLGLSDRIRMPGGIDGAARIFAAFDLFVLSSRSEGTPVVLLEAMASGTPIIASAVGGIPDLLSDDCGWLVPAENPAALAAAIKSALDDPAERQRRAARASDRVTREYDADTFLTKYEAVYRSAIAKRAEASRG